MRQQGGSPSDQSETVEVPRAVIEQANQALRKASVHLIAFSDANPYPDDPRWSPWTRFQKPVADRCYAAREALLKVLGK